MEAEPEAVQVIPGPLPGLKRVLRDQQIAGRAVLPAAAAEARY